MNVPAGPCSRRRLWEELAAFCSLSSQGLQPSLVCRQVSPRLCLHTPAPCISLGLRGPVFLLGHQSHRIRLPPKDLILNASAKTLLPHKVTFTGTRD